MAIAARRELVFTALPGSSREEVLRSLAQAVADTGEVLDSERLFDELVARERLGSTAIGGGVAIPHAKIVGLRAPLLAVGLAPQGLDYDAPDGEPVRVLFLIASPAEAPAEHLRLLAAISRWLGPRAARGATLLTAGSAERICALLAEDPK
ncbi:MAG: PTS sugar transporter subunit IIA [Acidobacteriota bacterium]